MNPIRAFRTLLTLFAVTSCIGMPLDSVPVELEKKFSPSNAGLSTHDTPDGFVERAVAIIVRGRQVDITYQIGINPTTMRTALKAWNCQDVLDDEIALNAKFCELLNVKISETLEIQVDGSPLEFAVQSVEPFARHHKAAVVTLRAELPESESTLSLEMVDASFAGFDGAVRYAIKANSNTILTGSNAAPILQRAERIELVGMEENERLKACRVEATLKYIPQKN